MNYKKAIKEENKRNKSKLKIGKIKLLARLSGVSFIKNLDVNLKQLEHELRGSFHARVSFLSHTENNMTIEDAEGSLKR